MISANELRIGNIVKDADGNNCTIRSIDSERSSTYKDVIYIGTASVFIHKYNGTTGKWIESLSPIKLTEELLLKCGFERHPDLTWLLTNGMITVNTGKHNTWQYSKSVLKEIKYWDQLQNVFFALHQRELEGKL